MEVNYKIFVIIVTYKGQRWYDRCFTSLRNSDIPVQTVVIDNASNDGTVEYIREHFPEIYLIESKENLGFGRANNLGMRYALDNGCDYVFLLNQDAWLDTPDTLKKMVEIYEQHPEYGVLTPMHVDANKQHLNISLNSKHDNIELLSDLYLAKTKDVYTITYANAAAWLLSRKTLETIGGFCPLIFHYGEDDDYMNRLSYHNIPLGLCPSEIVIHDKEIRIDGSQELSVKAQRDGVYEFLNINHNTEPLAYLRYYVRKWILSFLRNNVTQRKNIVAKIQYLISNSSALKNARCLHKTKGMHWL